MLRNCAKLYPELESVYKAILWYVYRKLKIFIDLYVNNLLYNLRIIIKIILIK